LEVEDGDTEAGTEGVIAQSKSYAKMQAEPGAAGLTVWVGNITDAIIAKGTGTRAPHSYAYV